MLYSQFRTALPVMNLPAPVKHTLRNIITTCCRNWHFTAPTIDIHFIDKLRSAHPTSKADHSYSIAHLQIWLRLLDVGGWPMSEGLYVLPLCFFANRDSGAP